MTMTGVVLGVRVRRRGRDVLAPWNYENKDAKLSFLLLFETTFWNIRYMLFFSFLNKTEQCENNDAKL